MRLGQYLVLAVLLSTGAASAAEEKTVDLSVGGYNRTYVYHAAGSDKAPRALVLVLPEAGVSGETALGRYRWSDTADEKGFIAVGLNALPVDPTRTEMFQTNPSYWSDGSGRGNAHRGHLDDVAYVDAVLDDLASRFTIDPKRVYATGLGNGGSMVNELGVRLSNRFAAIAPVEGHLWNPDAPARPLSVALLYGKNDPVDPLEGGLGLNPWTHGLDNRPSAMTDAEIWKRSLACSASASSSESGVSETVWNGCAGNTSLSYLVIADQGHHWPGGADDQLSSLGPSGDFDAAAFIWTFFDEHPRG